MRPLWVDPEEAAYGPLVGDLRVDVAIIGGGLSGAGAAYALRERDVSVALLEARTLGSGASGRNGGFVLAGPALDYTDAIRAYGPEMTLRVWDFTLENNRLLARIVEDHEIDCGYLRRGSLSLAATEPEWEQLQVSFRGMCEAGIHVCLVMQDQLPRPFDRSYFGGIYYAGNAEMSSGAFVRGVGGTVSSRVHIFEHAPVRSVHRDGRWRVETDRGRVEAEIVVLATNAWTGRILPRLPITPTRGQVIATAPLERAIVPFPMYADLGYQYWRQTPDGRLVVGGWRNLDITGEQSVEERLTDPIQDALRSFATDVIGAAPGIEYQWAGIMAFTPDMTPLVGPVAGAPNLHIAAGYSGHGVSMAFLCGGRVALRALGEDAPIPEAFEPARFDAELLAVAP